MRSGGRRRMGSAQYCDSAALQVRTVQSLQHYVLAVLPVPICVSASCFCRRHAVILIVTGNQMTQIAQVASSSLAPGVGPLEGTAAVPDAQTTGTIPRIRPPRPPAIPDSAGGTGANCRPLGLSFRHPGGAPEPTGSAAATPEPTDEPKDKSSDESSKKSESERFIKEMQRLQKEGNAATLLSAKLSNDKTLNDARAKILRGTGESVKEMAPR